MKETLALAVISMFIAPLSLISQGQELTTHNQSQQAAPQNRIARQNTMPGMPMPQQQTLRSREGQQLSEFVDLLTEVARRPALRLKDFEDLALANNPAIKQAESLVRRSAGQARQAGLYPNPSAGYTGEEIRGGSFGGGENGGFIQQNIVLGGKLGLRRRVFEEQRREDELGVIEQRYRLTAEVGEQFYSALAAQELANLQRSLSRIADDAVETAHQLANVGQADEPDILQAEEEAQQAVIDYVAAQRNYLQAFSSLAVVVGKPELPVSPLEGRLDDWPKLDTEQVLATVVRDSPSVKRAQQAVQQAEAKLRSAQREAVPNLQLRAGIRQDSEPLNEAATKSTSVGAIGFVTLGVSIPIFNRNQGNVQAARAELERAQADVTRVQLSLRRMVQPFVQNYLTGQLEAERYKSVMIPRATRSYQLYLAKYRQMAAAYPQVIISQRTLFQLQVNYLRVLERLWVNAIALRNFSLSGALDPPVPSGSVSTTINLPTSGDGEVD